MTPCMTQLFAGPMHYCAIGSDGRVRCWGIPGALGDFADAGADKEPGATPAVFDGLGDVVDLRQTPSTRAWQLPTAASTAWESIRPRPHASRR